MKPTRLTIAQKLCRYLPPIIAQQIRSFIYPYRMAQNDDHKYEVYSQTGSIFVNKTSDFHGYPFSVHGYYEWRNLAIAAAISSVGDTIVEIGANIGTETIGFSDIVGQGGLVHAFEPLPSNLKALNETLTINGKQNVIVYPFAVSDKDEKVHFVIPVKYSSGTGHVLHAENSLGPETLAVDCVTLDSFSTQIGPSKVIFIDTEGEEVRVLRGSRRYIRDFQPVIVLEASPKLLRRAGFNLCDLYTEIKSLNYKLYRISRLSLQNVNIDNFSRACNLACVPEGDHKTAKLISSHLKKCGLSPFISRFNPLSASNIKRKS